MVKLSNTENHIVKTWSCVIIFDLAVYTNIPWWDVLFDHSQYVGNKSSWFPFPSFLIICENRSLNIYTLTNVMTHVKAVRNFQQEHQSTVLWFPFTTKFSYIYNLLWGWPLNIFTFTNLLNHVKSFPNIFTFTNLLKHVKSLRNFIYCVYFIYFIYSVYLIILKRTWL